MKVYFILTFVLLTFTLTKSAETRNGDVKKEDAAKIDDKSSKSMPDMTMEGQENDENDENTDELELMLVMSQCNESFRVEMSYLTALNESGSFPDETDRTPKCYIRCVLETTGVASAEGQFDAARAAAVVAAERGGSALPGVEDMATACSDRKESCKCERSYQFMKCVKEMILMKIYEKQS